MLLFGAKKYGPVWVGGWVDGWMDGEPGEGLLTAIMLTAIKKQ